MTPTQRKLVAELAALYETHDHMEAVLLYVERNELFGETYRAVWGMHDNLERELIEKESRLPQSIVEKLKRGEL